MVYRYYISLLFHYLTLPGIVIHEISHATAVILSPQVKIVEVDLTSHVKHKGYYTFTRMFFISYAPFLFNSLLSLYLARVAHAHVELSSAKVILETVLLLYFSLAIGARSLPSYTDALGPWTLIKHNFKSITIIVTFPIIFLLSLISLPGLILSYTTSKISELGILIGVMYGVFLVLVGFGIIQPDSIIVDGTVDYIDTIRT